MWGQERRRLLRLASAALVVAGCISIRPVASPIFSPGSTPAATSVPTPSSTPIAPQATSTPAQQTREPATPTPAPPSREPATPTPAPPSREPATPTPAPTPTPTPPGSGSAACTDDSYDLFGWRWDRPYEWRLQSASIPDRLDPAQTLTTIERAASNITDARNDCGLPDNVDATAVYLGDTANPPCGGNEPDGVNVIGFAPLPDDIANDSAIAFVCRFGDGETLEVDMFIREDTDWVLEESACVIGLELFEPVVTHEFGHVFGLAHVGERHHGYLTMSASTNGFCDSSEKTLGLGDVLGLEELY